MHITQSVVIQRQKVTLPKHAAGTVIEWFFVLKLHWKQVLLLYLNTKQNTFLLSKYVVYLFQSSFINVHTVTQMSMLQFI